MPGRNKNPLLGWHPPAQLAAWIRAEADRRDVTISMVLNEIIEAAKAGRPPKRNTED